MEEYGPKLPISKEIHAEKHRGANENFYEGVCRVVTTLHDNEEHRTALKIIMLTQRFMAAGRIQASVGAPRKTTPYNCFVARTIGDSMSAIMQSLAEAAETMRMGGGIGYDFSTLRPNGSRIVSLDSKSSGPVSFMDVFNSLCGTIRSAGHRRGAQMGVLRIDHPDIEEFVRAKQNPHKLTNFNMSVAVTDEFMRAVEKGTDFDLMWGGEVYSTIDARSLWDEIMRSNWDWAEPGVLFIDRINEMNNLYYCETIAATNPCAEQPLPPHGACLLGSYNLTKYMVYSEYTAGGETRGVYDFDWDLFKLDIPHVVRAMDNVVDYALYPLPEQEHEAKSKRRMGLGVTGLANAGEAMGLPYGSDGFLKFEQKVLRILRDECYRASIELAKEKGPFPMFQPEYLEGKFIKKLPQDIQDGIKEHGIRNSHLTSIAPTGTISLCADNISSGIEPVFMHSYNRSIITDDGPRVEKIDDYGIRVFGVEGKTIEDVTVDDHLGVLLAAQKYTDSAVSKTCNVGDNVTFAEFKDIYFRAWKGGAKGCTTYRAAGKRDGVLTVDKPAGEACYIDKETGNKTCE